MLVPVKSSSTTFPLLSDPDTFAQKAYKWLEQFEVACFLDHNAYSGYLYNSYDTIIAAGVRTDCLQTEEAGAFENLKHFASEKHDWLFGFLSYDLKNDTEDLSSRNFDGVGFPALHFFQPRIVLEIVQHQVKIHTRQEDPTRIYQSILNTPLLPQKNLAPAPAVANGTLKSRVSRKDYLATVEAIRQHIKKGDIYEMNYCQEFYMEDCQINPTGVFQRLNRISKAPFSAFYKLKDRFLLCASPERFLKKEGNTLISQPIKGTIKKGHTAGENKKLKEQLYHSAKDRSENVMIVDLVRNDLSRSCIAGTVRVEELFGIYTFEQVHHLISTVTGRLKPETNPIEAIRLAFPMGSMTGAPKVKSMELIEAYEKSKRGLFSGAVGYLTPNGDFDFNVVIRSILYNQKDRYLSVQTGGAIVFDSLPENEYEECLLKAKGMFSVLGIE